MLKDILQLFRQLAKNLLVQNEEQTVKIGRIKSVDVFRGLAIALMIAVDNQGDVQRFYPQMRHAIWNGITLADFAFPIFVFIAGMVIPLAIDKRMSKGDSVLKIIGYICSRSVGLFLTGLFLNGFPIYDLSSIRIMGVLQRISIAYFVASIVTLLCMYLINNRKLLSLRCILHYAIAFGIVLLYFWLYKGNFLQNGNLAQLMI
jgi:predicted acyltransferase